MELKIDKVKLQKVVDDFYNVTSVGIIILNSDLTNPSVSHAVVNPYCDLIRQTSVGRRKCAESDKRLLEKCQNSRQAEISICHGGLVNIMIPIMSEDIIVGYVMLYSLRQAPFSEIAPRIAGLSLDMAQLEELYKTVDEYDVNRFESVSSIAAMLAKYVILEDMIKLNLNTNLERAKEYINQNLSSSLSIQEISKKTHISKSTLYKAFHNDLNCTINEYITVQRIKKASALLQKTDMTLDEIALATGFSNADYLGRVFKKMKGSSPSKYRKMYADSSNR